MFIICLPFLSNRSLISQLQKLQSLIAAKVPRAVTARSTQTSTCLMVRFYCTCVMPFNAFFLKQHLFVSFKYLVLCYRSTKEIQFLKSK